MNTRRRAVQVPPTFLFWFIVVSFMPPGLLAKPGDKKWEKSWATPVSGTPAVSPEGHVLVPSYSSSLYSISAQGQILWSIQVSNAPHAGSVSVGADGRIYFASADLRAFNPEGGFLWAQSLRLPRFHDSYSLPILGPENELYVLVRRDGISDFALALDMDGGYRWDRRLDLGDSLWSMGADGRVHVTDNSWGWNRLERDGDWILQRYFLPGRARTLTPLREGGFLSASGKGNETAGLLRKHSAEGNEVWSVELPHQPLGGAVLNAVGDALVVLRDGSLVSVSPEGQMRWTHDTGLSEGIDLDETTPAVAADGTVYVAKFSRLVAVDAQGNRLWTFESERPGLLSPVLGEDGTVYVGVGFLEGGLIAMEGNGNGPANSGWSAQGGGGRLTRSIARTPSVPLASAQVTASLGLYGDRVVIQWSHATDASAYRVWRSETNASSVPVMLEEVRNGTFQYADWSAEPGVFYSYFVTALNGQGEGPASAKVLGRRKIPANGDLAWRFDLGGDVQGELAMNRSNFTYAVSGNGKLHCIDPNGRLRWNFSWGGKRALGPSLGEDGTVYFVGDSGSGNNTGGCDLMALSPEGVLKWRLPLGETNPTEVSIGTNGMVYLTTCVTGTDPSVRSHLLGISTDGEVKWDVALRASCPGRPLLGVNNDLRVRSSDNEWSWIGFQGESLGTISLPGVSTGEAALDGDLGLISGGAALSVFQSDGTQRWTRGNGESLTVLCVTGGGNIIAAADGIRMRNYLPNGNLSVEFTPEAPILGAAVDWTGNIWATLGPAAEGSPALVRYSLGGVAQSDVRGLGGASTGPVIGEKLVVFGASRRFVHGLRTSLSPGNVQFWAHAAHDPARTGRANKTPVVSGTISGFQATQNTRLNDVRLTWNSLKGATRYFVMRSTTPLIQEAVELAVIFGRTQYEDSSATPDVDYYYWIVPQLATGKGTASESRIGKRKSTVPGDVTLDLPLGGTVPVPPAVGTNGVLYIPLQLVPSDTPGSMRLRAYQSNGELLWTFNPAAFEMGLPCVGDDGSVYFATRSAVGGVGFVHAVNLQGESMWKRAVTSPVGTPLALGWNGQLFYGDQEGSVFAVRSGDGTLIWSNRVDGPVTSLAVDGNDSLYVQVSDRTTWALDREGVHMWRKAMENFLAIQTSGSLLSGNGLRIREWLADGSLARTQVSSTGDFGLLAVDPRGDFRLSTSTLKFYSFNRDGGNLWEVDLPARSFGSPALADDGTAFLTVQGGKLLALDDKGSNLWSATVSASLYDPILAANREITLITWDSRVMKVFAGKAPSELGWSMPLHDSRNTCRSEAGRGAPGAAVHAIVRKEVVAGGNELTWGSAPRAGFYEVWRSEGGDLQTAQKLLGRIGGRTSFYDSTATAGQVYRYWVRSGNPQAYGGFVEAQDEEGHELIAGQLSVIAPGVQAANPLSLGHQGVIYAASTSLLQAMTSDLSEMWALPLAPLSIVPVNQDGSVSVLQRNARLVTLDDSGTQVGSDWTHWYNRLAPWALDAQDHVIYTVNPDLIYCQNPQDGKVIWIYDIDPEDSTSSNGFSDAIIAPDGDVLACDANKVLHRIRPDGRLRWRIPLGESPGPIVVGQDGTCYLSNPSGKLRAIDAESNARWSVSLGTSSATQITVSRDGSLFVSGPGLLNALDKDGRIRWSRAMKQTTLPSVCIGDDGVVYWVTFEGVVEAADAFSGETVWSQNLRETFPNASCTQHPLLAHRRLYVQINGFGHVVLAVSSKPAEAAWNQYRANPRRTARLDSPVKASWEASNASLRTGEPAVVLATLDDSHFKIGQMDLIRGSQVLASTPAQEANTPLASRLVWPQVTGLLDDLRLRVTDLQGNVYLAQAPAPSREALLPRILNLTQTPARLWQLELQVRPGVRYIVERSESLVQWVGQGSSRVAVSSTETWVDSSPLPRAAYYRIRTVTD